MRDSVLSERVGNYRINVYYDEDCANPRTEWDEASHMVIRNRYVACENDDVEGTMSRLCEKYGIKMSGKGLRQLIDELNEFIVIKPISVYTHSGSTVYYGEPCDRWDSGVYGFGYMEREDVYGELCGRSTKYATWREQAEAIMQGEMETFDRAVRGEVFGFTIEKLTEPSDAMKATPEFDWEWWESDERNWEDFDSCWGFYMTDEEVLAEAKGEIPQSQNALVIAPELELVA